MRTHARPESALAAAAAAALQAATSNGTAPENVVEQLSSLEMDSVVGQVAFDGHRQRLQGSSMVQLSHYRNGPEMFMPGEISCEIDWIMIV